MNDTVLLPICLFSSLISTLHNRYMCALLCDYFLGGFRRIRLVMEYTTSCSQTIDISVGQNWIKRVVLNFEIESNNFAEIEKNRAWRKSGPHVVLRIAFSAPSANMKTQIYIQFLGASIYDVRKIFGFFLPLTPCPHSHATSLTSFPYFAFPLPLCPSSAYVIS